MAFKLIALLAVVAVARAGVIGTPAVATYANGPVTYARTPVAFATPVTKVAAPLAVAKVAVDTEFDPNPQYTYSYDIQDALTGDSKGQQETRNGDVVRGSYSLVEPDGTRRTVEYTADDVNGFNAVVHRQPAVVKATPVVAKVAHHPLTYATPVAKVATPLTYASPALAHPAAFGYGGPIAKTYIH